jgi:hypothetical protein
MIRTLRFKWRVRRLKRDQAGALRPIDELVAKAEAARDWNTRESLRDKHRFTWYEFEDEIGALTTVWLTHQAAELMVPVPSRANDELWTESEMTGQKYLTPAGIAQLRSAIRHEKKERREVVTFWSSIVFTILSLLVALAAVLRNSN